MAGHGNQSRVDGLKFKSLIQEIERSFSDVTPDLEMKTLKLLRDDQYLNFLHHHYNGRSALDGDVKSFDVNEHLAQTLREILVVVQKWMSALIEKCECELEIDLDAAIQVMEAWLNAVLYSYTDVRHPGATLRSFLHYFGVQVDVEGEFLRLCALPEGIFCERMRDKKVRSVFFAPSLSFTLIEPMRAPRLPLTGLPVWPQFLSRLAGNMDPHPAINIQLEPSQTIFWLRMIQREICALTEEWEFENAAMAHDFITAGQDRKSAQIMAEGRDCLAIYVVASLSEFSAFVGLVFAEYGSRKESESSPEGWGSPIASERNDIRAELEAAHAVLLASMQKVLLPASVSRHGYHLAVAAQIHEFANNLLSSYCEDYAIRLMAIVMRQVKSVPSNARTLIDDCLQLYDDVNRSSTLKWYLSHDPSPSLKSFSWAVLPNEFLLLVLVFGHLCWKRQSLQSQTFDETWSAILVSTLQMPKTFPPTRFHDWERRSSWEPLCDKAHLLVMSLAEQSRSWFFAKDRTDLVNNYQAAWDEELDSYLKVISDNA